MTDYVTLSQGSVTSVPVGSFESGNAQFYRSMPPAGGPSTLWQVTERNTQGLIRWNVKMWTEHGWAQFAFLGPLDLPEEFAPNNHLAAVVACVEVFYG